MKFREYLESLNELAMNRRGTLDMDVVYAKDDEGNGYQRVHHCSSVGSHDGEFTSEEQYKEDPDYYEDFTLNAVCIN